MSKSDVYQATNMDKRSHIIMTSVMIITYIVSYSVVIIYNSTPIIPLIFLSVIMALSLFSHLNYYAPERVDPRAKVVLIVQMVLVFIMHYFDYNEDEYLYLFLLTGDAIFAFDWRFSTIYTAVSFLLYIPYNAYLFYLRNQVNYFATWSGDAVLIFFIIFILYLTKSQISDKMKYNKVLNERNHAYRELAEYAKKIETMTVAEERGRIAYMLHNSLGHRLVALNLTLQAEKNDLVLQHKVAPDVFKSVEEQLSKTISLLRKIVEEADDFLKSLSPEELIEMLVSNIRNTSQIDIYYNDLATVYLPNDYNDLVYNIIMEAITNALKHANASRIDITLNNSPGNLHLVVSDDGDGFDEIIYGFGLEKMISRVEDMGGTICIESKQGCSISVTIPVEGEEECVQ